MPKLRPETEQAKAKALTKPYIEAGLNQAELARKRGVTRQTINEQVNRKPVQKILQETIDRSLQQAGITNRKVYRRLNQQLDAMRDEKKGVPDHTARDKAIDKCLTLMGHIKQANNNGKGVTTLNILYGHRANMENANLKNVIDIPKNPPQLK